MNYAIKPLQDWFAQNAMNPMFAIAEFCKHFKVEATITPDNKVTFKTSSDSTINSDINECIFEFGTWVYIGRSKDVESNPIPTEPERESTRKVKK